MNGYLYLITVSLLGVWIFADGFASLWQYTKPEIKGQSWLRDHSLRIFRCLIGLYIAVFGGYLIWLNLIWRY